MKTDFRAFLRHVHEATPKTVLPVPDAILAKQASWDAMRERIDKGLLKFSDLELRDKAKLAYAARQGDADLAWLYLHAGLIRDAANAPTSPARTNPIVKVES